MQTSKTCGPTKKVTRSDILLQVLYYGVRSWFISQGNQAGYNSGGGIINYTLQLEDPVVMISRVFTNS